MPLASGCSNSNGELNPHTLRVLNWEDYIYEPTEEGEPNSIIDQFKDYIEETEGFRPTVIYDTFDTNETMLNSLKTGKYTYDLICPSDYTIQKMLTNNLLEPYDFSQMPNYSNHCSPYLRQVFKNIKAYDASKKEYIVDDYAAGYMWGTLGILYNPTFSKIQDRGISEEQVQLDMSDWNELWDNKYNKTISIKDSMRDTYSVGIMRVYDQELKDLKNQYYNSDGTPKDGADLTAYNNSLSEIFNRHDKDTINKVQTQLLDLKNNIFGFEVDSGKEDINTGKIGINLAWSGDAVYSMDKGDAYGDNGVTLYYQIPKTGGNIWFDGWVMPKSTSLNKDLAQKFIDFISNPTYAALNMYGIGYSSFIGGDDIMEQVKMWYDPRAYVLYQYDADADDWVYDDEGNYVKNPGYEDKSWNDVEIDEAWTKMDLSYFFTGTGEYTPSDMTFYTEEINRQFQTQYPSEEEIARLAVMDDYGDANSDVLNMWEIVKTDNLHTWALILLIAEIVLVAAGVSYYLIHKQILKKKHNQRRLEEH
jgi:spermidine/putrescine transport system substrate-binding protein